jgi:hypothetical protein
MAKVTPLPCGGHAVFDHSSGCSYRCLDCLATIGSIGQPRSCKEQAEKYDRWKELGGAGWDYTEVTMDIF